MAMLTRFFSRLPMPKSLRNQFSLALLVPAILIAAGGLVSFYDSYISTQSTRQLAQERMSRLEQAQDLARQTLLIEHDLSHMLDAGTVDAMQASYLKIIKRLELSDAIVLDLGQKSNDISLLNLNQAGQLFRNTIHIVAQLRKNLLDGRSLPSESGRQLAVLTKFKYRMQHQAVALVEANGVLSTHFTWDYMQALQHLNDLSEIQQVRGLIFLGGSIFLAWLASLYFVRHRVSNRLQKVSDCLRFDEPNNRCRLVPVHGDDEIGEMARAVEKFLADRQLLVQTQQNLKDNIAELEKAFDEIKTLRGIIPICSSCKKIRDDKGYWNRIETYIRKHSDADFSHSICPACAKKLYPDIPLDFDEP